MVTDITTQTRPSGRRRFRLTERRREYLAFLLFVLPDLALLAIWTFWPFLYSLYLSLTDWNLLRKTWNFVGLANYVELLHSPLFWQITRNTLIFAAGVIVAQLTLSLALAVLLNQKLVGRGFWRLVIFSPHITTTAAMALVWSAMYAGKYGVFANAMAFFGADFPDVLGSTKWVLPALMLVSIWKGLGFNTVVFLAALQGVDPSLKEAASIDGANAWQSFWHVSFPAISPVTYFLTITGFISAIQTFDVVSVMTSGGPSNASNVYVFQIYREVYRFQRMGVASTLAVLMFVLIMAITFVQTRLKESWVSY